VAVWLGGCWLQLLLLLLSLQVKLDIIVIRNGATPILNFSLTSRMSTAFKPQSE